MNAEMEPVFYKCPNCSFTSDKPFDQWDVICKLQMEFAHRNDPRSLLMPKVITVPRCPSCNMFIAPRLIDKTGKIHGFIP